MKRTFIAIDIKRNIALNRLVESYKRMLRDEKIKWVDLSNLHLTLAFLGDIDEDQINRAGEIMYQAANNYKSFEVSFNDTGVFRDIRKPRVIWMGIEAPESLYDLHEEICKALREGDIHHDEKPFKPHLTLGRIKYIAKRDVLADILRSSGSYNLPPQIVNEIILYESILKPDGPAYRPLKKALFKSQGE